MAATFNQRLRHLCSQRNSLLCVGLDPDPERMPDHARGDVLRFNLAIIEATSPFAVAFKLNAAFYECLGPEGWRILAETVRAIPDDVVAILDAKRGDIGNSSRFYARAAFAELGCDAVTVNPYMGRDAVEPFTPERQHGVFVLCLTSNPGARDFQCRKCDGRPLYEHVALAVKSWNERDNLGLVVGATQAGAMASIRRLVPDIPFLVPGIGAQGGDLVASVHAATDAEGLGAIFNVSRAILYASRGEDFAQAAAEAARAIRDRINQHRREKLGPTRGD